MNADFTPGARRIFGINITSTLLVYCKRQSSVLHNDVRNSHHLFSSFNVDFTPDANRTLGVKRTSAPSDVWVEPGNEVQFKFEYVNTFND